MADEVKFSGLPVSTILNVADLIAIAQAGVSKSATIQQILNAVGVATIKSFIAIGGETSFTLDIAPTNPVGVLCMINGLSYQYGVDFNVSGVTVNWISPTYTILAGDIVWFVYNYSSGLCAPPVTSVFTRIGDIVAAASDYDASQVDNDSGVTGVTVKDALDSLAALITVSSVFGRIGAVVATASDYDASQVDNDSTVTGATVKDALDTLNVTKSHMVYADSGSTNYSLRRARSILATGSYRLNFNVPYDFTILEHAYIVLYPSSGAAGTGKDIDISVEYTNGVGNIVNQYTAADTTSTYDLGTVDTLQYIEITSLLTSLAAGSFGGVFQDNKGIGGAVYVFGILITYK